jgi:hypothetical protein
MKFYSGSSFIFKDKDDDKKKNKKETKDNKNNNNQASSEEEDLDDMHLSKHASKKGKPEKGQGLTLILETKIHNFDVKVEVTGINTYYV